MQEKKKILYFIPEFPRLTETFIRREVQELVELGNLDITVFSLRPGTGELPENVEGITVYKRLNLIILLQALLGYLIVAPIKLFSALKLVLGKDRIPVFQRLVFFLKGVGYAKLFSKYNPDHLHIHFLSWPSTIGMVAARLLNVPFSISAHARDVTVDNTLVPAKVKNAKFISICNKYAWQKCIELSGVENPRNIYLQYHGVDPKKLAETVGELDGVVNKPYIFIGSRLVEKKGLDYAIKASKILADKGVDHEVHIAGPGPLYEELVNKIKGLRLEKNVFIHGGGKGVPHNEMVKMFKMADIFSLPSIETGWGDVDGVPTVVIEAALLKLPIVVTNAGSITDLILNGETGLLVPQKDEVSLAESWFKIISDKDLRVKLGENAYNKAREMFDLEKNVRELESLFFG